jgi:hypothetical protein
MSEWATRLGRLNGPWRYLARFSEFDCGQFQEIDNLFKATRFRYALRVRNHFSKIGAVHIMPPAFCKRLALPAPD